MNMNMNTVPSALTASIFTGYEYRSLRPHGFHFLDIQLRQHEPQHRQAHEQNHQVAFQQTQLHIRAADTATQTLHGAETWWVRN